MTSYADYRNYLIRRYGLAPLSRAGTGALALAGMAVPPAWLALDRPIFIVGCSRAGTTLFTEIFGAHRDCALWMDAAQVWDPRHYDKKGDDFRDEGHATAWQSARLRTTFGLFARLAGKRRLVNKNNQNALKLRMIDRVFPGCLVLHVMRDARPVVLSNVTRTRMERSRRKFPFGRFPKPIGWRGYVDKPLVDQFAHQWADITAYVQETGAEIFGPDRYNEVRFEEFCAFPEHELNRIDAFCGLAPGGRDPSLLTRIGDTESDAWRAALSPEEIETIHRIAGRQMARLGYGTDGDDPTRRESAA